MKIIKSGKDWTDTMVCRACRCEFEYSVSDLYFLEDGDYVDCPECKIETNIFPKF